MPHMKEGAVAFFALDPGMDEVGWSAWAAESDDESIAKVKTPCVTGLSYDSDLYMIVSNYCWMW